VSAWNRPDDPLVSTEWLAERLDAPDVRVVDASWFMPGVERMPKDEHAEARIPGAVFFDIDEIADTTSGLPHMLPSPEKFSSRVRKLGLGDGTRIVVYDSSGVFSAARVWWTFRVMGHEDVTVLDGGLPKWRAEGLPMDDGLAMPRDRHFTVRRNAALVCTLDAMKARVSGGAQVVDARPAPRFLGDAPEPRAGLKSGHMPGATNVPSPMVLNPDGTMKTREDLEVVFAELDLTKPITATCGSGITASLLALALARMGRWDVSVYDGSWAEWGSLDGVPVVVGP